MFVGPLFSANIGGHLSISTFRMSFLLIPLYLLAAVAAAWLIGHKVRTIRLAGCAVVVLVLAAQVVSAVAEINRDNAFLGDLGRRWQPDSPSDTFQG